MIEKIRQTLILKYTVITACILFLGFIASYSAYRHNGIKLLQDSLYDYLTEEEWEAREAIRKGIEEQTSHKINADIQSLHNFTYWFVNKKIIHSERPWDDKVDQELKQRLSNKEYTAGKIYHENIKVNKQKWYFIVIKETLQLSPSSTAEIFVLANYTPIRKNARAYVKISLVAALVAVFLAYIIGNFFAKRSMHYIEQSYQKQKEFVSDAAHELRTPLSILYSYIELLEYNPKKQEIITDIKNELQHMNDTLDRLLTIARYDNKRVTLQKTSLAINQLISSAVCSVSALHSPETFRIFGCENDIIIEADEVMIRQLLYIFLDNAVKYTPNNKNIEISLSHQGSTVKITIKDNGIGIKEQDLPHIFDRFWQAEKSRHQKGLGLGLSLADAIVKLHNGTISVQSAPQAGTTFEITLPVKQKG